METDEALYITSELEAFQLLFMSLLMNELWQPGAYKTCVWGILGPGQSIRALLIFPFSCYYFKITCYSRCSSKGEKSVWNMVLILVMCFSQHSPLLIFFPFFIPLLCSWRVKLGLAVNSWHVWLLSHLPRWARPMLGSRQNDLCRYVRYDWLIHNWFLTRLCCLQSEFYTICLAGIHVSKKPVKVCNIIQHVLSLCCDRSFPLSASAVSLCVLISWCHSAAHIQIHTDLCIGQQLCPRLQLRRRRL